MEYVSPTVLRAAEGKLAVVYHEGMEKLVFCGQERPAPARDLLFVPRDLPPLRDDILPLVEAFLAEIGSSVGRSAGGLSEDTRDRLLAHAWPGNVRELRNAVERAVILCDDGLITSEHPPRQS